VRTQPELIPELHRRASRWYEESGDIQAKLSQGEVARVLGWFDRLPEAILGSAPMLCICKAWALVLMQRRTRTGEVERALRAADHALDRVNAGQALRNLVAGHAASIQAFFVQTSALIGKKPDMLIALAKEAQRLLPVEEKTIRSDNARLQIKTPRLDLGVFRLIMTADTKSIAFIY
jgi:ATP/maltotriose-dependent transcriptional regulator MalT